MKIAQMIGVGILVALSVFAGYFAFEFLTEPDTVLRLMRLGVELAVVFVLWMFTIGRKKK